MDQEAVNVLESGNSAQVSPCGSDEFALEVSSRLHVPVINPGCGLEEGKDRRMGGQLPY